MPEAGRDGARLGGIQHDATQCVCVTLSNVQPALFMGAAVRATPLKAETSIHFFGVAINALICMMEGLSKGSAQASARDLPLHC